MEGVVDRRRPTGSGGTPSRRRPSPAPPSSSMESTIRLCVSSGAKAAAHASATTSCPLPNEPGQDQRPPHRPRHAPLTSSSRVTAARPRRSSASAIGPRASRRGRPSPGGERHVAVVEEHDGATGQRRDDVVDDRCGRPDRPLTPPRRPQHQLDAVVLGRGQRRPAALAVRRPVPPWPDRRGPAERRPRLPARSVSIQRGERARWWSWR